MVGAQKRTNADPIRRADDHLLYRGSGIVRYRPIFILALSFGAGIFFVYLFGLAALAASASAAAVAAGVFAYRFRKKRISSVSLVFVLLVCMLYALGGLSFSVRMGMFERSPEISGDCSVAGTVEEIGSSGNYTLITVRDLWVIDASGNEYYPDAGMQLSVYGDLSAEQIGATVMFDASVATADAWMYGRLNASAVIGNLRYRASAAAGDVVFSEGNGVDVFSSVRRSVRNVLFENMDGQTAAVAYGMLTGDSGFMDGDALQNFRYGGIAHIFAVSGLHIGVVYALFARLCKKLRLKKYFRIPLIFAALWFYAGVCGFSPSSVRALIMCTVAMLADAAGLQYDRTGSVACAALAVMAINPAYLFSAGFQLSVAAAGGIVIFGGHLTRLLRKVRFLPQKICSAIGVALSAQMATFPLLIDCFGYVSAISFFLNLLFVPVISAVYAILFCAAALAAALPFAASVFLFVPEYMLRLAVMPVMMLEFDVLLICGFSFGGCVVLWYILLFLLSDKVNLKPVPKLSAASVLCAVLALAMFLQNSVPDCDAVLTLHTYYGSNVALLRSAEGDYLIAFGEVNESHVERLFLQEGVTELCGAIFLADASTANTAIPVLLKFADLDTVYVPLGSGLFDSFRTVDVRYESGFFEFGCAYAQFYSDTLLYLNIRGADVICDGGAEEIPPLPACDLLLSASANSTAASACSPEKEVCFEKSQDKLSVYRAGDLQIVWKNAIISITDAG